MRVLKHYGLSVLALALSSSIQAAGVQIPVVPVALVENAARGVHVAPVTENAGEITKASSEQKATTLIVKPGVNEIIPVSQRHINRIVTPFPNPDIKTASMAETKVEGNVIYVVPADETPVTMFVMQKGETGPSMSLTLVPRKVPPLEVTLKFGDGLPASQAFTGRAAAWETSQPYVQTLVSLLRGTAKQQIPPGYNLGKLRNTDYHPACEQDGLEFSFSHGQVLRGHHFNVAIGTMTNVSKYDLEFVETSCADWVVAAAASFPHVVLQPGQISEVYVVSRTPDPSEPRIRPSLVYEPLGANKQ